jgi:tetratricopeptide (TPR) repeat protein
MNKGEIIKAKAEFENAYNARTDSLDFALGLAKIYVLLDKNEEVKQILLPFNEKQRENFELYFYLGVVTQELEEYEEAISFYQKALSQRGNVIVVLNSIGECHLMLGNKEQAVEAWEKSLEINPNQEEIKKRLIAVKEKEKRS